MSDPAGLIRILMPSVARNSSLVPRYSCSATSLIASAWYMRRRCRDSLVTNRGRNSGRPTASASVPAGTSSTSGSACATSASSKS